MIHLLQLLCPHRHAIGALLYDDQSTSVAEAKARLKGVFDRIGVNPWCGICGSTNLAYEDKATHFKDMASAESVAHLLEDAQIETRKLLDSLGATYDQQRKN